MSNALPGLLLTASILVSHPAWGQTIEIIDSDAAALAAEIAAVAESISVPGASSSEPSPEREMQERIDQIATLASSLESDIGSGRDRAATRKDFVRLKQLREKALELVVYHQVEIDPEEAKLFSEALAELDRYYAQSTTSSR